MPAFPRSGRGRGHRRRSQAIAALMAGLCLLTGCTTPLPGHGAATVSSNPASSPTATPTASSPKIKLSDCAQLFDLSGIPASRLRHLTFTCGKVAVPLDYDHPNLGTIDIEILRVHDDQQTRPIGSLLVNPGGPGVSGLGLPIALATSVSDEIMKNFDLVGFDPRGVGLSSPIQCIPDTQHDQLAALDPNLRTPSGFAEAKTTEDAVAQECSAKYGTSLADYNTVFTAMDMDRIRLALGDPELNYLGFSYGSALGAEYAHLYPSKVRVAVLDGAVDPTTDLVATLANQMQGFENAFDQFAAYCLTWSACKSLGDPREVVESLAAKADVTPLKSTDPKETRTADGAIILTGVLAALYDQQDWQELGNALVSARKGDPDELFALADSYNGRSSNATFNNLLDVNTAIYCNDHAAGPTDAVVQAAAAQWPVLYPMFGAWGAVSLFQCQDWQPIRHPLPVPVATGSNPILVIGSIHDPATPYPGAQHLASALTTGQVLTWDGEGHTAYTKSKCIDAAVDTYLVHGTLPTVGTVCPG